MAEGSGSRTHQERRAPLTGFEVRAPRRGRFPSRVMRRPGTGWRVQALAHGSSAASDEVGPQGNEAPDAEHGKMQRTPHITDPPTP